MALVALTYSYVNGQIASGPEIGQNFLDLINGLTDGTKSINVLGQTGSTSGSTPTAGLVGSKTRSAVTTNTNFTSATTYEDITSITLPAGNYSLSASAQFNANGATATRIIFFIGTVIGNDSTGIQVGDNATINDHATLLADLTNTIADYSVSITTTTTFYLKANCTYSAGTPRRRGRISAIQTP